MQLTLIIISLLFIALSVWYAHRITTNYLSEKALLLRVGITLVIVLLAMWIVDIVVFSYLKLLHEEIRNEIIVMIKTLFVALVVAIVINEKLK